MSRWFLVISCLLLIFTCDDPPYGVDCNGEQLDCLGECAGPAVEDECGVCNGPGFPDGDCDCDGNILDDCLVCGGDGTSCLGCTDSDAVNYDDSATIDNEVCIYAPISSDVSGTGNEGDVITATLSATDSNGEDDEITFNIISNPAFGGAVVIGEIINVGNTFTATATYTHDGSEETTDTFTYTATDLLGNISNEATATITIGSMNDAPQVDVIANQEIDEDASLVLTLSGNDADADAITFSVSVDGNSSVVVDGTTLTVTPDGDFFGDILVTVLANDGTDDSSPVSFTLTVNSVNDAPILAAIGAQSFDEEGFVIVALEGSDVDGDDLTFSEPEDDNLTILVNYLNIRRFNYLLLLNATHAFLFFSRFIH